MLCWLSWLVHGSLSFGRTLEHYVADPGFADVGNASTRNSWELGEYKASCFLAELGINFDFDKALADPTVDFIRPNGNNIYPGNAREKDRSIIDDGLDSTGSPLHPDSGDNNELFLPEDDAPTVFLGDFLADADSSSTSDIPDSLPTDAASGGTKCLHKASIISTLFNSDFRRLATTRLLRVRCYTADGHKPTLNPVEISDEHSFNVGNLAVALIRSHNTVAAAVVRVIVLERGKARVGQVDVEDLGSPDSTLLATAQPLIMQDVYVVGTHRVQSTRKWVWTGDYAKFEPLNGVASTVDSGTRKTLTVKVLGALLHPLDAEIEDINVLGSVVSETMRAKNFSQTWSISNNDLMAVVSAMYEGLDVPALLQLLPKHTRYGKSKERPISALVTTLITAPIAAAVG
ncbi:hypothetical protein C8F04DRAFT_1187517 [Mycena alexandri]|uniref:Uncharacterized protein n=1 Tax=Mycena alexandri TaxID=1745969 RepID=A0AAD6SNQ7_9AGAR|nr:hypothetical protein C8F04DRAFT_1187517 [Mycena alexandri]